MSQSLSCIFVHMVFHVKNNFIKIRPEEDEELYAYMGSIIKDNMSIPIIINGVPDHVHILCILSKNMALAKLFEEVKKHSSRWIKTKHEHYKNFKWQGGYGAFSVSPSAVKNTKNYILNQKEHHKKVDFKTEYLELLDEYEIDYNEQFLWED